MIEFIVPTYTCEKYIKKCLQSIVMQKNTNWKAHIVDDCSYDNTFSIIKEFVNNLDTGMRNKFNIISNDTRQYALYNVVNAITNFCDDNSIIAWLDGDDWLYTENAVDVVMREHNNADFVCSRHIRYPNNRLSTKPSCSNVYALATNHHLWDSIPHMRTFKKFLFDHINKSDFVDNNGNFYRYVADRLIVIAVMQLAGIDRCKFIDQVLYVYNSENVLSTNSNPITPKHILDEKRNMLEIISKRKPYSKLDS